MITQISKLIVFICYSYKIDTRYNMKSQFKCVYLVFVFFSFSFHFQYKIDDNYEENYLQTQ